MVLQPHHLTMLTASGTKMLHAPWELHGTLELLGSSDMSVWKDQ